jgi:hypothetical protein
MNQVGFQILPDGHGKISWIRENTWWFGAASTRAQCFRE